MEATTKTTKIEWPTSSQVQTTEYIEEQRALIVTFKPKMAKYRYDEVNPTEWVEIVKLELTGGSIGKHINASIKPTHPFTKVD